MQAGWQLLAHILVLEGHNSADGALVTADSAGLGPLAALAWHAHDQALYSPCNYRAQKPYVSALP